MFVPRLALAPSAHRRPGLLGLALLWLAALLLARPVAAGSRDQKWRTLQTEHFYIHYYNGISSSASLTNKEWMLHISSALWKSLTGKGDGPARERIVALP